MTGLRMVGLMLLVAASLVAACGHGPVATSSGVPAAPDMPVVASAEVLAQAIDPTCEWKVTQEDPGDPTSGVYLFCEATGVYGMWAPPDPQEAITIDDALDMAEWWCGEQGICDQPMVFGGNWTVIARTADQAAHVVAQTGGYLVPVPGKAPPICERETSSTTRIFVTVSPDEVALSPSTVTAGPAALCWQSTTPGRVTLFIVRLDSSVDSSGLVGGATVHGSDLVRSGGTSELMGAASTFESDEPQELSREDLRPGRYLFVAQHLGEGSQDPAFLDEVVGHAALLTVTEP